MASRHRGRIIALQGMYQLELVGQPLEQVFKFQWYDKKLEREDKELAISLIKGVTANQETIDTIIEKYSKNWELSRISVVNKCILRMAIFSIVYSKDIPDKVIIDEALELTREYESEPSVNFVNGILDAVIKKEARK